MHLSIERPACLDRHARSQARREYFSSGKDAGLISSLLSNSIHRRDRAPTRNDCACGLRARVRGALLLASRLSVVWAIFFAACTVAPAQSLLAPPPARIPAVEPTVKTAQLSPPPSIYPQTVPAPEPLVPGTSPNRVSFRSIRVYPRTEGLGSSAESVTTRHSSSATIRTASACDRPVSCSRGSTLTSSKTTRARFA